MSESKSLSFSEQVWNLIKKIPKGKVTTYGEIARALGKPGASRAVGQALKRNPYAPEVPCHRVVRSDGTIGGFRGANMKDVREKADMLRQEGVSVTENNNRYIIDMKRHAHRF